MKKTLFLSLCFSLNLFANSLVDIYRFKGLKTLENAIEQELQDPSYWKKYIQNKNVSLGYYEKDTPLVIVDKQNKFMKLYRIIGNELKLISEQEVITGKMGDKLKEGDLKTPVGVYDITRHFVPQDAFYGPKAYVLSYPNTLDKLHDKNGYGIWIHGSPLDGTPRPPKSRGCVVMDNDIIEKFDKDLKGEMATVIIFDKEVKQTNKDDISIILANLYQWKNAWKHSNIDEYLSFYDLAFERFDGKNIVEFGRMKARIFARKQNKNIIFSQISISKYPRTSEKDMYRVRFYEDYSAEDGYTFKGFKELYIRLNDKKMQIFAEK